MSHWLSPVVVLAGAVNVYENHYNIPKDPFKFTPDEFEPYKYRSYTSGVAFLQHAIEDTNGVLILLSGATGVGKSTLINNLLKQYDSTEVLFAELNASQINSDGLIFSINLAFELNGDSDEQAMIKQFQNYLDWNKEKNLSTHIIIEDAHDLSPDMLKKLGQLSRLYYDNKYNSKIILVGNQTINQLLDTSSYDETIRHYITGWELDGMNASELNGYVSHRLKNVDGEDIVSFEGDVWDTLQRFSSGIPRRINRICNRLLINGLFENKSTFTNEDTLDVVKQLDEEGLLEVSQKFAIIHGLVGSSSDDEEAEGDQDMSAMYTGFCTSSEEEPTDAFLQTVMLDEPESPRLDSIDGPLKTLQSEVIPPVLEETKQAEIDKSLKPDFLEELENPVNSEESILPGLEDEGSKTVLLDKIEKRGSLDESIQAILSEKPLGPENSDESVHTILLDDFVPNEDKSPSKEESFDKAPHFDLNDKFMESALDNESAIETEYPSMPMTAEPVDKSKLPEVDEDTPEKTLSNKVMPIHPDGDDDLITVIPKEKSSKWNSTFFMMLLGVIAFAGMTIYSGMDSQLFSLPGSSKNEQAGIETATIVKNEALTEKLVPAMATPKENNQLVPSEEKIIENATSKPIVEAPKPVPPVVSKPAVVDPKPVQPVVSKPAVVDPKPAPPVVSKPAVVDPKPVSPVVSKPAIVDPKPVQPVVIKPAIVDPKPVSPVVSKPAIVDPKPVSPVVSKPAIVDPKPVQPVVSKPAIVDPKPVQPVVSKPTVVAPKPVQTTPDQNQPKVAADKPVAKPGIENPDQSKIIPTPVTVPTVPVQTPTINSKQPAFTKIQYKFMLQSSFWYKNNSPAILLPSELNKCSDSGTDIYCLTIESKRHSETSPVAYQTGAMIQNFTGNGTFTVYYRSKLAETAEKPLASRKTPEIIVPADLKEREMLCRFTNSRTITCMQNGLMSEYNRKFPALIN